MNIITVIPLTRSKIAGELSYFTASDVPLGAVVSVPLRSKSIHGIVTSSTPAEDLKSDIKNAPFEIRKLGKMKASAFFPSTFIQACKVLADYYATSVGNVIDSLVSDSILENASKIAPPLPKQTSFLSGLPAKDETYAVQGDDGDRMSSWRSLIRQEFARKRSLAIYVPTIEDGRNVFSALEKGIEEYIYFLNGGITKKKVAEIWTKISESEHPVVIIATGSFSVLPRGDIDNVIIERENNRGWISQKNPYIDFRNALESISRKRRQSVFLADSLLRSETLYRLDQHEIDAGSPFKWRSISNAEDLLVDMHGKKKSTESPEESTDTRKPKFRVLSPELEKLIEANRNESTHLFIMSVRRGIAPMTVCDDCETVVTCNNCSSPVVLHTSPETGRNFFMCHKCGERRSADETCRNCGGWRLSPLGIGIERVAEEIRFKFPDIELFQIDSDATKTDKQIGDVMDKFRAKPGSILLGTELALHHLTEKVDHTAVVTLDSLFTLPDFRIQEKIMYTLIRLRFSANRSILVQTRKPEEKVFEFGLKGNLSDFYRMTLQDRKQFAYPPFSKLIKITIEGKKDAIAKTMGTVQKALEPVEIDIFPAFTSTEKGNSVIHGLIKLKPHAWPDMEMVAKLRSLPPEVSIKIDPESLL